MLKVVVECAKAIPKKTLGIPDPIAAVIFKGEKKKTKAITSELNPVWNEILEFDLKGSPLDSSSFIDVVVKDYETIGKDKLIGSAKILLRDLASGQIKSLPSRNVPLVSEKKQDTGATISLLIGYEPPASAVPNQNAQVDGDASGEAGVSSAGKEDGDEETTDWGDPRTPGDASTPGQPGKTPQKMIRANRKRQKALSNKPQDFQIRIRVIEARQLPGNNIKPVVKVSVCGQTHRTRIKRGNNPFFDEIFFYNMNMLPSELFDENIYIRLYNSSSLRSDSLLGEFKLDVGYVYDEPAHAIMKKWLLLSDPDDSSSGARGYLKVNMIIVGTGDEPPSEKRESNEEQDDIESNLLLTSGVTLRSATLSLKVYRAEDMPQMDDAFGQTVKNIFGGEGDKKNLVDPFLEVCFAGKKLCTKIIEKNANPEWNQVIHLQVKFPSMCERIKLTMFDWDRFTSNDTVGTTFLNLSKISSSGGEVEGKFPSASPNENGGPPGSDVDRMGTEVGFLPAFGPCYLNLYGSTREFSDLPDPYEELNLGQRGRWGERGAGRGTWGGEREAKARRVGGSEDQGEASEGNEDQGEASGGNEDQGEASGGNEDQGEASGGNEDQGEASGGSEKQERDRWGEQRTRRQGQRVRRDVHSRAEAPNEVHSRAAEPNDVHSRAAGPSDVHRRAAASSDVHRRALAPSDVHRRTTAPGRRCPPTNGSGATMSVSLRSGTPQGAGGREQGAAETLLRWQQGEGVAYRGRVLIELSTRLEDKIDKKIDDLSNDDVLVAQKYQRKRKYSLCAVFHTACMLQEPGEPIQFEVSIGNYGNKMDSTCKPLASTTQYSCAVFDGNHYYYLPWADTKPVVILTSFWEDINHRLDSVNIILFIADRLQANITTLKTAILAKVTETRLAEIWLKLINQLIEDLTNYRLPDLEAKPNLTALDVQMKKLRDTAFINIRDAACRMRDEATDVKATLIDIDDWLERIQQIAEEPQNSMPDIIIWMLRGEKRMAYARIPANEVLFSTHSEEATGKYCGKTQTIFMKYPMDKNKGLKIPVQLRLNMWLGLSAHEKKFNSFAEGTFSVYAEMYENQAQVFGKWGTTGLVGRHKFSDVTGKVKLKQECFLPPRGWEWECDWYVDPESCLLTEADAGHTEFTDEVYENESRFPGGEWKPATEHYTDVNGEKAQKPSEIECPPGWRVIQDWSFDSNRAVDEKGWEYGITLPPDDKPSSWVAAEKMYHVHRRKRLVRLRKKIADTPTIEKKEAGDGWEYSSLIGWKFHRKERSSDTFRRRRWRRKMAPSDRVGASAIFKLEGALGVDVDEKTSKKEAAKLFGANTPTVSCNFSRSYMYHLRVYVYQARNLLPMDKDSFSDPYCHVSFLHVSKTTEIIKANLNPTWDQTLIFNDIEIYGDPQTVAQNPPNIVLELFDSDQVGKDESMGRCTCPPVVKLNPSTPVSPKLLWFPVTMKGRSAGEMLVAAELLLKDKAAETELPIVPPRRGENLYMVPQGIRPVVQLTAIEILAWGLRNMKAYQLAAVTSPSLIVECGGQIVQTGVIKNIKKNPNFPGSVLFLKVLLPKEEMYTPPIVLKVIDHRPFGRKPIVGQCTIDSLEEYRCDPYMGTSEVSRTAKVAMMVANSRDVIIDIEAKIPILENQPAEKVDEAVDWWSKFYASLGEHEKCGPYLQKGYSTLTVFGTELENVSDFHGLTDFCNTFKLVRGKSDDGEEDPSVVGEFKASILPIKSCHLLIPNLVVGFGSFRIYPLSDDPDVQTPPRLFRELPESGPQECLVRIYVLRCVDLQPKDNNGLCDPYLKITLGKKTIEDRDNYKPNTLNPEFGRMYELSCFLPQDKDLKISVYDFDLLSRDEKVGDTVIDLENRLLSRFNALCGLSQSYCVSGVNQWRDQLKPSQILDNFARLRGLPPPQIPEDGSSLSFGGRDYSLQDLEASKMLHQHLGPAKERICLHVLRKQGLVPEHVETRTLYSSFQRTLSQGKIQMWVDIFPKSLGTPGPPVDISPRKAKKHYLRVVIWNTTDVILDETSITGEKMSDIYVKGWMPGMEEDKQKTDVHYRSLDGDGNFNWRFVFGFDYLPAEQLCLVSKKDHFWSLDKTEFRTPPKLTIQIWDNDKFSLDDYLGTVELDLVNLIPPTKTAEKCRLDMLIQERNRSSPPKSLFAQKCVRGWWPCAMEEDGKKVLTGKVEMTLEIVDDKEVEERPAGKGRDEPNMNPKLDPPNRPDTSFLWFTNPCKSLKFIVWRRYKWLFIGLIILILVLLFVGILLYSLPNYISMKIVKPF
ncbi:hypothetical protein QTP86_033047 [Hemibagrus guttatus]|nr:hypothetical protein QTP86_033047 [Hemibagrus guttatus]